MSHNLKVLTDHREALLLAEVAAWLHDDFKHTDAHIYRYVTGAPQPSGGQNADDLVPSRHISLLRGSVLLSDIKKRRRQDFADGYLNRCHYTAHIEKQDGDGPQHYPAYTSSPFGYEGTDSKIPDNLAHYLRSGITWNALAASPFTNSQRKQLRKEIKALFDRVGGDTRRPANEITLWEWGHTVGALYKAALAGALLGFQPQDANDLRWRLLSVRFDGLSFFAEAYRLPDLLARRELFIQALNKVQELLEVQYPLGTKVYRDESGSVFVVPGCEKHNCTLDLLSLDDGTGSTLRDHILRTVSQVLDGENVPNICLDESPWWGQDPQWRDKQQPDDELPPVAEHVTPVVTAADPEWVAGQWGATEQICTVCGLRPQGPGQKPKERGVCNVCEERRADRSKKWASNELNTTIWTDEVADDNGRLALIVGQFDLEHWLDGLLVRTLVVRDPANASSQTADAVAKNPSFARIRRIWETTRTFWQEIEKQIQDGALISLKGHRLAIRPADAKALDLGPFHTYELVVEGIRLSVVWDKPGGRFITADNLGYLAGDEQLGKPVDDVVQPGYQFHLEEPTGYGGTNRDLGAITVDTVERIEQPYPPVIPILAEPRTFMALVPARHALDVACAIKTKYEREMGKVRNRLPLHLGIVYAHRRTPLRAVMDAGRRMLKQKALDPVGEWRVAEKVTKQTGSLPRGLTDGTHQFAEWYAVRLENRTLDRSLTWYIPAVMGDGQTEDAWYP